MEMAPIEMVKRCRNKMDAMRLCVQLSHSTHESIAIGLGINKGNFSKMLSGQTGHVVNFPTNSEGLLMELCGNYAPMQYTVLSCGFDLVVANPRQQRLELAYG